MPFYIGKGKDNRAFDHLYVCLKERGKIGNFPQDDIVGKKSRSDDAKESDKKKKINNILDKDKMPVIEILARGFEENEALDIEMAMIDLLQGFLTNIKKGENCADNGRITLPELKLRANATPLTDEDILELKGKTLMLNIGMVLKKFENENPVPPTYNDIYEMTRRAWKLDTRRLKKITKVFAVSGGVVKEVFDVAFKEWENDTEEVNRKAFSKITPNKPNPENDKYKGRDVKNYCLRRWTVRYI